MIRWSWAFRQNVNRRRSTLVYWLQAYFPIVLYPGSTGTMTTYARPCLSTVQGTDVSCTRFAIEAKLFLSSVMPTGAGGGSLALPSISAPPSDSAFIEMGSGFIAFLPFLYPFLSPLLCLFSMV